MSCSRMILNYTVPPSLEDIEVMAEGVFETLPEEIARHCEDLTISVEEIADETTLRDLRLDDSFDLLALYRNGKVIAPGVETKVANDDDALILYRRAMLDMWCETGDDLDAVIRHIMIEELGRFFEFSDEDVEEMAGRHY
ncbi:MAG: metallopeptidase family protein [Alphaproteobacteria bacterium]